MTPAVRYKGPTESWSVFGLIARVLLSALQALGRNLMPDLQLRQLVPQKNQRPGSAATNIWTFRRVEASCPMD